MDWYGSDVLGNVTSESVTGESFAANSGTIRNINPSNIIRTGRWWLRVVMTSKIHS